MAYQSINPATDDLLAEYPEISDHEMFNLLDTASQAFDSWRKTKFSERRSLMNSVADSLIQNKERYGRTMTLEMGKPLKQAIAEVEKCAGCCRYYAENAEKFLSAQSYKTDYSFSEVHYEPLGIVYAVMPWNFPLWQVIRCATPAIMAGNVVVLKHAQNVPQSALVLQEAFDISGFPDGVFTNLFITHKQSDKVISHPGVKGISLTGSERAGGHVSSIAGKDIKRSVLELGGSDPFIVLTDADLDKAAKTGCQARMQNNGQSCIAAKRFILVKDIADAFLEKFLVEVKNLKIGDPLLEDTTMGPLARRDLVDTLEEQVTKSVASGARVLTGGNRVSGKGCYYEPTVLTDIPANTPAYNEEMFGPVASVFIVNDEKEAIALANDTTFGLGSSLWTKDTKKALELSKEIQSGSVYINTMVKSDARIPFGGIKKSGFGRELSDIGIKEFVNIKTVVIS
jgi:succinate-semialdehyde dehydrogenase / glutarate-semialdehyde dehydrogenase